MATAKPKAARKKSAVLTKAASAPKSVQLQSARADLATLRDYLKGYKVDHRQARSAAAAATKELNARARVVTKQLKLIDKATGKIEKLKAA